MILKQKNLFLTDQNKSASYSVKVSNLIDYPTLLAKLLMVSGRKHKCLLYISVVGSQVNRLVSLQL